MEAAGEVSSVQSEIKVSQLPKAAKDVAQSPESKETISRQISASTKTDRASATEKA